MRETLWSGHWNGSINLWDADAGSLLRTLSRVHDGCVWALQPLAGQWMASAGADGGIQVWDAGQAELVTQFKSTGGPVYALASTGGTNPLLISAGHDGHLRLWDVRTASTEPIASLHAHNAPVRSLLVHGSSIWSGSTDGTVRRWDLAQLGVQQ